MFDENHNRLTNLIAEISNLRECVVFSSAFKAWRASVERHLRKTWPDDNSYLNQFQEIAYSSGVVLENIVLKEQKEEKKRKKYF